MKVSTSLVLAVLVALTQGTEESEARSMRTTSIEAGEDEYTSSSEYAFDEEDAHAIIDSIKTTSTMQHESNVQDMVPLKIFNYAFYGDDMLEISISVDGDMVRNFLLEVDRHLMDSSVSTYATNSGEGWITATLVAGTGNIHGVWFDATSGKTFQFSHEERIERLLGEHEIENFRALRASSPGETYFVQLVDDKHSCATSRNGDEEKAHRKIAKRFPKSFQHLPEDPEEMRSSNYEHLIYSGSEQCYPDDFESHYLDIGIVADKTFSELHGNNREAIQAEIESVVEAASQVYGWQFNVKLRIKDIRYYEDYKDVEHNGELDVLSTCSSSTMSSLSLLQSFARWVPDSEQQAHWHLLTNCYPPGRGGGVVGTANVGTAGCHRIKYGWHTGVSTYTRNLWLTFAHEVGHGLDMDHSFESGVGRTGGIMDYGNPYVVDSVVGFQPNRGEETCAHFHYLKESNCKYFVPTGPTKQPTQKPTRAPTTRAPTTRFPTLSPTNYPTQYPTPSPTPKPTKAVRAPRLPKCSKVKFEAAEEACPKKYSLCSEAEMIAQKNIWIDTTCTMPKKIMLWTATECGKNKYMVYNVAKNKIQCTKAKKKMYTGCCKN